MAWLALGIALLGAGEFLASNLADCLDMARHLFLFHACTDLTVCFAVAWGVEHVSLGKGQSGESGGIQNTVRSRHIARPERRLTAITEFRLFRQ
jgi:hypothetical protein